MDLNGEIDGLPNRSITLAAQPTGPTHSDFHCFTLHVAGGDDGGLFLLSSAVVGREDSVVRVYDYVLCTLDSLGSYVYTNVGKIMSISSFIVPSSVSQRRR